MTFSEKIRSSREMLEISQTELAEQVGVSRRTIVAYEAGEATARKSTIAKLARVLKVSTKFLSDENCDDPLADIEKDPYVEQARPLYGGSGARDMEALLRDNAALFAGGELSQDEKDAFFEAITQAYFASKNEAKRKFGPKG
jgi:transcriptional regulator with XRE-family HTH domain